MQHWHTDCLHNWQLSKLSHSANCSCVAADIVFHCLCIFPRVTTVSDEGWKGGGKIISLTSPSEHFFLIIFSHQEAEESLRFYRNVGPSTSEETEPFKSELEKLRVSNHALQKTIENTNVTWSDLSKKRICKWKSKKICNNKNVFISTEIKLRYQPERPS